VNINDTAFKHYSCMVRMYDSGLLQWMLISRCCIWN